MPSAAALVLSCRPRVQPFATRLGEDFPYRDRAAIPLWHKTGRDLGGSSTSADRSPDATTPPALLRPVSQCPFPGRSRLDKRLPWPSRGHVASRSRRHVAAAGQAGDSVNVGSHAASRALLLAAQLPEDALSVQPAHHRLAPLLRSAPGLVPFWPPESWPKSETSHGGAATSRPDAVAVSTEDPSAPPPCRSSSPWRCGRWD